MEDDRQVTLEDMAILEACDLLADGPDDDEDAGDFAEKIRDAMEAMQAYYRKLMEDPEIMEEE